MREFSLINEYGQEFSLMNVQKGFFQKPKGLGASLNVTYTRIGTRWIENSREDKQSEISGELIFAGEAPYSLQEDFLVFVRKSKKLTLKRKTTAGTYKKDVDLIAYDQGEIEKTGELKIPVIFAQKSLWYLEVTQAIGTVTAEDTKRYDFKYNYTYSENKAGEVEIRNNGSEKAPWSCVLYGPLVHPVIKVVQDAEEHTLDVDVTINTGEKMLYSSKDGDLYLYKEAGGSRTNLASGEDCAISLANDNFFKLPVGTSRIQVTSDTDIVNPIIFTVYKEFRAC